MKILITGANGFIAKNLIEHLKRDESMELYLFSKKDSMTLLEAYVKEVDFIFHSAGVNRPLHVEEFYKGNRNLTEKIVQFLERNRLTTPILLSSSTQATVENDYGKSKLKAEQKLLELEDDSFNISIIRTPIVYGYGVKANIKSLINLINKVPILPFTNIQNKRSMVFVGNLCHLVDEVIIQKKAGIFLASDDEPLSTTRLIELIANGLDKRVYLLKIPFFESLLKFVKPSFHKRLYESLEVNNEQTKKVLNLSNPYSVEEGIRLMLNSK